MRRLELIIERIAWWCALLGGLVLIAVILLTVTSVMGRALLSFGLGPIPGDFELVEMAMGFVVFAFLPWCLLQNGHAVVDIFEFIFGRFNIVIDVISSLLMLVAAVFIAWRLAAGMIDKKEYSETSFILQIPVWHSYAAEMIGAVVFILVAVFCVFKAISKTSELRR